MLRFITPALSVLALSTLTGACADAPTAADENVAPQTVQVMEVDPGLVASCHAAYKDALDRVEAARDDVASCVVDADCTVAVAETRCTGEIDQAVSKTGEAAFLGTVDRLDVRLCGDVAPACTPSAAEDPAPRTVACVESRCTLVAE